MEQVMYRKSYKEYKAELDGELQKTAEGFVKIGYLLKVARDTNVLAESGYKTVAEFAEAEYNLNKTQVSRFMSINDRFSENGYSERLAPAYQGFGYAKLTIMLQLPDAVNEVLTPEFSKAEIQEVKEEMDKERKVSDLEVYMEGMGEKESERENLPERLILLNKTVRQLGEDEPEIYVRAAEEQGRLRDIMAPSGDRLYSVRVKGAGRMMLAISETQPDDVKLINSRTGEKEEYSWEEVRSAWEHAGAVDGENGQERWEQEYKRKFPVAPVQQPEKPHAERKREEKPKKESRVKTGKDWKSAYMPGQMVEVIGMGAGKLLKKTDKTGFWEIEINNTTKTITEKQFGEFQGMEDYEETEGKTSKKPEKTECGGDSEEEKEPDVQVPGQTSLEYDFAAMNQPEEKARENTIRGYRAAVANNLNTLRRLWEGEDENKLDLMIGIARDLKWRLEQLKEAEE